LNELLYASDRFDPVFKIFNCYELDTIRVANVVQRWQPAARDNNRAIDISAP